MAIQTNFDAALVDLVNDLTSAELFDFNNVLYESVFEVSELAQQHTIVPGVRNGSVIPIIDNTPDAESFPFVDQTSCDVTETDLSHNYSSHRWPLGLLEERVSICMRSFSENFLVFWQQYRQTQQGEPDLDTALLQFLTSQFSTNLQLASWRAAYFADSDSASPLFNDHDGIFAQMEAGNGIQVEIPQNAGADFAGQQFEDGEEVYELLKAMYRQASLQPWFNPANLEYRLTMSMAGPLINWLNDASDNGPNCNCIDPNRVTGARVFGLTGLQFNGIPVRVHREWDTIINGTAELNGGGGAAARVNPHRAILAPQSNVLIGTTETDALHSLDVWYSKDQKKVFLEGSAYLGGGVPQSQYVLAI